MPATPRDWADPFLEQAREDLAAAWCVARARQGSSALCMLLQMVFEKLAKAAYARSGKVVPQTHVITSKLFQILRRHPVGMALIRGSPNVEAFVAQLEAAHPQVAGRQSPPWPQLEYPWEDAKTGMVLYPARDLALVRRVYDPQDRIAVDCLRFASTLAVRLSQIVP